MLKILSTQYRYFLNKIEEDQELFEDAARLLCQALIGEGDVYIYGKEEMDAVVREALYGQDRHEKIKRLVDDKPLHHADRALLFVRSPSDEDAIALAKRLYERYVPFAVVTTKKADDHPLESLSDVYIHLGVRGGIIPTESGKRIGHLDTALALYTYICIRCLIDDILSEYE